MDYLRADPGVQEEESRRRSSSRVRRARDDDPLRAPRGRPASRVPEAWELLARPIPPPSPDPAQFASSSIPGSGLPSPTARPSCARRRSSPACSRSTSTAAASRRTVLKSPVHLADLRVAVGRADAPDFTSRPSSVSSKPRTCARPIGCTGWSSRSSSAVTLRRTWVLKSPVHLHAQAQPMLFGGPTPTRRSRSRHRDPLSLLASLTSLIATLRWSHSDVVEPETHVVGAATSGATRRPSSGSSTGPSRTGSPSKQVQPSSAAGASGTSSRLRAETTRRLYAAFDRPFTEETTASCSRGPEPPSPPTRARGRGPRVCPGRSRRGPGHAASPLRALPARVRRPRRLTLLHVARGRRARALCLRRARKREGPVFARRPRCRPRVGRASSAERWGLPCARTRRASCRRRSARASARRAERAAPGSSLAWGR